MQTPASLVSGMQTPSLTFNNIQNEIKPTKNLELFGKMCLKHNKMIKSYHDKKAIKSDKKA